MADEEVGQAELVLEVFREAEDLRQDRYVQRSGKRERKPKPPPEFTSSIQEVGVLTQLSRDGIVLHIQCME